ncbi:hypothetical protein BHE74_00004214 [Ensete ventricosum]|nr:hypothetical protein BHE74_00004214 [Ensete ventricosum]RZR85467.1 hypothetical protein BHM03_00012458 [Ensete ventricosum]
MPRTDASSSAGSRGERYDEGDRLATQRGARRRRRLLDWRALRIHIAMVRATVAGFSLLSDLSFAFESE